MLNITVISDELHVHRKPDNPGKHCNVSRSALRDSFCLVCGSNRMGCKL